MVVEFRAKDQLAALSGYGSRPGKSQNDCWENSKRRWHAARRTADDPNSALRRTYPQGSRRKGCSLGLSRTPEETKKVIVLVDVVRATREGVVFLYSPEGKREWVPRLRGLGLGFRG